MFGNMLRVVVPSLCVHIINYITLVMTKRLHSMIMKVTEQQNDACKRNSACIKKLLKAKGILGGSYLWEI